MSKHTITTLGELAALYGEPKATAIKKEINEINPTYRQWLDNARFFALATYGKQGMDCSPRGDIQHNAFKVQDNKTLLIPDRRGNNRLDSLRNIVENPKVGLLFLLPGITEALRINGDATLSTDPELLALFDVNGKLPISCVVVKIQAVYFQCARAILRSGLWAGADKKVTDTVPSAGQMVKAINPEFDGDAYDRELRTMLNESLY